MPTSNLPGVSVAVEPVFHYTDAGGLLGIVKNRVLWASEAAGMNDRAEVRQGWKKIRSWLKRQAPSEAVDLLRRHAKSPLKRSHEVFVICGSTRPDDANQWRLYANRGAGYAVEFDPSQSLIVVTDHAITTPTKSKISFAAAGDVVEVGPWLHVLYEKDCIETALEGLVQQIESDTAAILESDADPNVKEDALQDIGDQAYSDLAQIAHLIKEPGFAGENEVRIVTTFFWAANHIRYRAGGYGVMGYAELSSLPAGRPDFRVLPRGEASDPLPVRSVRLGPLMHKEHVESVESFLRNHGLKDVNVKRSRVPLR